MKTVRLVSLVLGTVLITACEGSSIVGPGGDVGIGMSAPKPGAFTCGGKGCPTLKVEGRITEGEDTPVALAIVSTFSGAVADTTDANGRFSLEWSSFTETCRDWAIVATHPNGTVQSEGVNVCYSANHDFKF